jgi:hypothetical protein
MRNEDIIQSAVDLNREEAFVATWQLATRTEEVAKPLRAPATTAWLYPQVLSLDAPLVAVLWQALFARSFGVAISPLVLAITAASVWMIYVGDHLMDVRAGLTYSERHQFAARHSRELLVIVSIALLATMWGCWRLPVPIFRGGTLVAAVVAIYVGAVHFAPSVRPFWPKEIAAGLVFGVGSSIGTWAFVGPLRVMPAVACFGALCTLNVAAVDCWEWQSHHVLIRYPHVLTRWIEQHLQGAAVAIIAVSTVLALRLPVRLTLALCTSSLLLMLVARVRHTLSAEAARLLADAALLTPMFFLVR